VSISIIEAIVAGQTSGTEVTDTDGLDFAATPSDGELIVFVIGTRGSTKGVSTGFTDIGSTDGAQAENTDLNDWVHVLARVASSESGSGYTITGLTTDVHSVVAYRISATNGWEAIAEDGSGVYVNATATDVAIPAASSTPVSAESIHIAAAAIRQDLSAETVSWTNSFVEDDKAQFGTDPFMTTATASRIVSSDTTVGTTASWTTSSDYQLGAQVVFTEVAGGGTVAAAMSGGGNITAVATQHINQVLRPVSTVTAGDWDTGPATGQNLHDYAGDDSDATYIEDTTV
jgi:hypothetical protein